MPSPAHFYKKPICFIRNYNVINKKWQTAAIA